MPSGACAVTTRPKQKEAYDPDLATYFFFHLMSPRSPYRNKQFHIQVDFHPVSLSHRSKYFDNTSDKLI